MISHDHEITSIQSLTNEILLTYSSTDTLIKVWRLDDEGCKALNSFKLKQPAISIAYDNKSKALAIMDNECKLGVYQQDFVIGKAPEAVEEDDDMNLSNLDMADLEDQLEATQDKAVIVEEQQPDVATTAIVEEAALHPAASEQKETVKSQESVVSEAAQRVKFAPSNNKDSGPVHNMGKALDDMVEIQPQPAFMSNCKFDEDSKVLDGVTTLHWSLMGTI